MATKNAVASDNCPVTPTSSVSPIAPIAALIANSPVCSQKASAYCGIQSNKATNPIQAMVFLDTRHLVGSEEAGRPPQQDREQDHVRHHVRESAAEEGEVVLISRRQLLGHADQEAADERAGRGVEPAEHRDGDRAQRE